MASYMICLQFQPCLTGHKVGTTVCNVMYRYLGGFFHTVLASTSTGEMLSYKELAKLSGNLQVSHAVGQTVRSNYVPNFGFNMSQTKLNWWYNCTSQLCDNLNLKSLQMIK